MKRSEEFDLRKKANDLRGLVNIKDYLFNDGPARGARAFDLKNGNGLDVTVLADRALDIPALSFRGVNVGLNNKVPVRSAYLYQEDGLRGFLRQFNGGMLTTCGLTYAGSPAEENGEELGLHGPIGNTPAENVSAAMEYEEDEVVLRVRGQVRQTRVFAENMRLTRQMTLHTEKNLLEICDEVENLGYVETPMMLIYHINFGYPMLDAGARIYSTGRTITPRTPFAQQGMHQYDLIEEPEAGREEQCYYHTDHPAQGAFAMLHNPKLGMAAVVRFDAERLPLLCQWKSMAAGDYALGLEPTTSGVVSRPETRENGMLCYLAPGEKRQFHVSIELLDDSATIQELIEKSHR